MRDSTLIIGALLLTTLLLVGAVAYKVSIWNECREFGHSRFYCLRMIGR